MNNRIVFVLLAVGVGAAAFTAGRIDPNETDAADDAADSASSVANKTDWESLDNDDLAPVLASLAQTLDEEIAERRALAEEIEALRDEVAALRGQQGVVSVVTPQEQAQMRRDARRFRQESTENRLAESGFSTQQIEQIRRREAEAQMQTIELDDLARREGWFRTPRYFEELNNLGNFQQSLQADLGDDGYDRYLFATGQPNRLVIGNVIETSPAEQAGLLPGDVITSYGGERVFTSQQLTQLRSTGDRGSQVTVEIIRDGQYMQIAIPRGPMGVQTRREVVNPTDGRGG